MAENYPTQTPSSVGRYEYFASDISGAPLTFKRISMDTLLSACGRYEVFRWPIGAGEFAFDTNLIEANGRITNFGFELNLLHAKRACELHAGRTARAEAA